MDYNIIHRPRLDLSFYALSCKCNILLNQITCSHLALGSPKGVEELYIKNVKKKKNLKKGSIEITFILNQKT